MSTLEVGAFSALAPADAVGETEVKGQRAEDKSTEDRAEVRGQRSEGTDLHEI
jgi:hypothetical protein